MWNFARTRDLLDRLAHDAALRRLCGWEKAADVPHESTFARAFAEFAASELPQTIHAALIGEQMGQRLVGHVSRDSTAIVGRERPAPRPERVKKVSRRRGRPRRGEQRPAKELTRLERQGGRMLAENLAELPRACDRGAKKSSNGQAQYWVGYKLHLDVADGEIPLSAILSSASRLHDSQAAIPLLQLTARRVSSLYDLMDSAYDAAEIAGSSRRLEHVPLIDPNPRRGQEAPPLCPAQRARFRERTAVERVNSDLKDNHGGCTVRVRGAAKVMCHLMLGVLVVTVKGLMRLLE